MAENLKNNISKVHTASCNLWTVPQMPEKETWWTGDQRKNQERPERRTVDINQNALQNPGNQKRLTVTQTSEELPPPK